MSIEQRKFAWEANEFLLNYSPSFNAEMLPSPGDGDMEVGALGSQSKFHTELKKIIQSILDKCQVKGGPNKHSSITGEREGIMNKTIATHTLHIHYSYMYLNILFPEVL